MSAHKLLITGGAGYIGSHVAWAAVDAGHHVVVLDDLSTGRASSVPDNAVFVEGDVADRALIRSLLDEHKVDAVLHFAGRIIVPESVSQPIKYYTENTATTLHLLDEMVAAGTNAIVFSSTAAVYDPGDGKTPLAEDAPKAPLSPYGQSKLMTEAMIADIGRAHGLSAAILRYFNVAGADPKGRSGQSGPNATHLIKLASQTAIGQRASLSLFGDDYETPDGTCIRDYIHVTDLAAAHLLALEHVLATPGQVTLNCGYSRGASVREVIAAVERVTGKALPVEIAPRRAGDAPVLVADNSRIMSTLHWTPEHDSLDEMVASALAWERKLNS